MRRRKLAGGPQSRDQFFYQCGHAAAVGVQQRSLARSTQRWKLGCLVATTLLALGTAFQFSVIKNMPVPLELVANQSTPERFVPAAWMRQTTDRPVALDPYSLLAMTQRISRDGLPEFASTTLDDTSQYDIPDTVAVMRASDFASAFESI